MNTPQPKQPVTGPRHRTPGHNQSLGSLGEDIAAEFLASKGLRLIARNWRCRYGELDLLMGDGTAFVGVEVKTRSGTGFGTPLEAITTRKAARLRRLLLEWSSETGNRGAVLRVDAVGITMCPKGAPPLIDHLRGIS